MEAQLYLQTTALLGSCCCALLWTQQHGLPGFTQPHCSPSSTKDGPGLGGAGDWPEIKGDCFASCYVLYSSKCALNTDSSSDLLPLCCQRSVRVRGARRQCFLDFSSLAAGQSSQEGLPHFCGRHPLLDSAWTCSLGPLGLVKSVPIWKAKSPLLLCPPPPALAYVQKNMGHRDCLKFYFKGLL